MKTIRDVLTGRSAVTVAGSATVLEAATLMAGAHIGALIVVNSKGLSGIFTERDLMIRVVVAGLDPKKTAVSKVMSPDVYSVGPEERINQVARELQARHIRHVPVVEKRKVLGMLSLRDLLREHLSVKRGEVAALTAYIQGEGDAAHAPDESPAD